MSTKRDTETGTARVRKVRQLTDSGPINGELPPENPGMHQHVCLDRGGRLKRALNKGAYDHQLDENGNPYVIEGKNNETFYVIECPIEEWNKGQEEKLKKATEPMDTLKQVLEGANFYQTGLESSRERLKPKSTQNN